MPSDNPNPEPEKKRNLASRALVAFGFGTVGAKLGTFGLIADANALLSGKNLSFGQKLSSLFDGSLSKALREKFALLIVQDKKSISHALGKTAKYGIILTAIGAIAGVAVGWTRGGRIDDWKDIIKHPIRSTKTIFGFDDEAPSEPPSQAAADAPEASTKWADYHNARENKNSLAGPTLL